MHPKVCITYPGFQCSGGLILGLLAVQRYKRYFMETGAADHFRIRLEKEVLHITNREGILYTIPLSFLAKETNVGDRWLSYQVLRLEHTGLFSGDELYSVANMIQQLFPASLVNWEATFQVINKDRSSDLHKKLRAFQLI